MAEVDSVLAQEIQRGAGESVVSDGTDEHDLGPGAASRQRLVGALAPRMHRECAARQRLTQIRQPRHACDQIEVDRTEDDDHRTSRC